MTSAQDLSDWEIIPAQDRDRIMSGWDIYSGQGYWTKLYDQAVAELQFILNQQPALIRIFVANNHGRLEVTVETKRGTGPLPGFDNKYRMTYRGLPTRQIWA